jgi:Lon protease-like protein
MVRGGDSELPIFELPVVLLPGELLPLHIFEQQYRHMIGRSLEDDEPFGIVFRDEDGSARRIGCTARVAEVLERFEDGRMNIVVAGEIPFRVLDRFQAPDFPAAEVELIDLGTEEATADPRAAGSARSAFAELLEELSGERPESDELDAQDAYELAGRIELPPDTKQRLLELRSEDERMRLLERSLDAVAGAIRRSTEITERARSNGRVTPP